MNLSESTNAYRAFCTQAPADFPLFMQDWYLDAVCSDGDWQAIVSWHDGKISGVWPVFLKKKWHWRYVAMPLMGKLMGPYIVPSMRGGSNEMRVLNALLDQFPAPLAAFQQDFNYTITNWLPLYWRGFSQTTRYSYVLPLQPEVAELWINVEKNYRRKVQKAQVVATVRTDLGPETLHRLCVMSFERQQLDFPLDYAYFKGIYDAFDTRRAGQAFFAVDKETGTVFSAVYLVWDQSSAYLLWGGDDPQFRSSGTGILLQWEAIVYAKNILQLPVFDFEGSMIQAIEQGRRYFGAVQKPYFRVRKEWSPVWRWGKFLFR